VLLKLAPEYPPQKPEDKLAWLEKQVEDGYYTVERYHKDDADTQGILDNIRETDPRVGNTLFIVNPIDDAVYFNVFTRVPIFEQYKTFVKAVVTDWDWGLSTRVRVNEPAFNLIKEKIPLSLSINFAVLLFYIPFGFLFGLIAALNKDSFLDNLIQVVVMLFLSLFYY
jgi:ABC-type microcin C transport system permease subunit YejB